MKKVYIPTEEEINNLEKFGVNSFYYLVTKTVETLIMADVIYEEEDMFEIAYDEFVDIPQIIYAIAKMYPERILDSERASDDIQLCKYVLSTLINNDKSIYGLNQIRNFKEHILSNSKIIDKVVMMIGKELKTCPRYRFEYQGPNDTLDKIFNCELETKNLDFNTLQTLSTLEPIYLTKEKTGIVLNKDAVLAITKYADIYGISAYGVRTSQLTSMTMDENRIKRLKRRLEYYKNNYNL